MSHPSLQAGWVGGPIYNYMPRGGRGRVGWESEGARVGGIVSPPPTGNYTIGGHLLYFPGPEE